uniref:Uncharacterized protein n=2 Tax=Lygus hesperus TaxID=30085 RepID=A0A0K8SEY4_LYGHE
MDVSIDYPTEEEAYSNCVRPRPVRRAILGGPGWTGSYDVMADPLNQSDPCPCPLFSKYIPRGPNDISFEDVYHPYSPKKPKNPGRYLRKRCQEGFQRLQSGAQARAEALRSRYYQRRYASQIARERAAECLEDAPEPTGREVEILEGPTACDMLDEIQLFIPDAISTPRDRYRTRFLPGYQHRPDESFCRVSRNRPHHPQHLGYSLTSSLNEPDYGE